MVWGFRRATASHMDIDQKLPDDLFYQFKMQKPTTHGEAAQLRRSIELLRDPKVVVPFKAPILALMTRASDEYTESRRQPDRDPSECWEILDEVPDPQFDPGEQASCVSEVQMPSQLVEVARALLQGHGKSTDQVYEELRNRGKADRLVLVGVAGFQGSGKDSVASVLTDKFGFERRAFADVLKVACRAIFGFSHEQVHGTHADKEAVDPFWGFSPRWALQRVGTEGLRRVVADDVWVRALERRLPATGLVVVPDVRFPNEVDMIRRLGGEVWLVERAPRRSWWERLVDRACDLLGFTHASERLPHRPGLFDRVVDNRGDLGHLRENVIAAYCEMVADSSLT